MKISFIGYGNMAKSIAESLRHKNVELRAAAPSLPTGLSENGIRTFSDNAAVIPGSDVLILAVKPARMSRVLTEINTSVFPSHCLIISVASGLNLAWFEKYLPKRAIVRAMPNIAISVGKGATPLIANEFVSKEQKQQAEHIFANPGLITWVKNENNINAFTALSGSGPAYIFMFMEAMINAAVSLGITEDLATAFALQTFNGAAAIATQSSLTLTQLRKTVTSPREPQLKPLRYSRITIWMLLSMRQ